MANKFYGAIALIGGTDGAIDKINDAVLTVADGAYAILTSERIHTYIVDGSGAAEDSPRIIAPDSGSVKRYKLNSVVAKSLYMYENAEYLYGVTAADAEEGLLRINSSDDTEIRAITGQSVDVIINSTKVADFAAGEVQVTGNLGVGISPIKKLHVQDEFPFFMNRSDVADKAVAFNLSSVNSHFSIKSRLDDGSANATFMLMEHSGAVKLYYNDTKTLETHSAGIKIYDGTATGIFIGYDSDDADCVNFDPGGKWQFRARNGADASTKTLMIGDPDGSVDLYHAGTKMFETTATGIGVTGAVDAIQAIFTSGTNDIYMERNRLNAGYAADSDNYPLRINYEGYASGVTRFRDTIIGDGKTGVCANFVGNGAADLYYAGTKKFETVLNGIQITGDGDVNGSELRLVSDDSTVTNQLGQVRFGNTTDDALVILRGVCDGAADSGRFEILTEPTGGGADFAAIFYSGGSAQLYHAGVKVVETEATGLAIQDTSGSSVKVDLKSDAGASVGYLLCANGAWTIYDSTNTDAILTSNAAGSVDLYYAGSKKFETTATGWITTDGTDSFTALYSSNNLILRTSPAGGTFQIQANKTAVGNGNHFIIDPDGSTELYYAGTLAFKSAIVNGKPGLQIGNAYVLSGSGTPESAVTAPVGSMYLRDDGGAGTTLYVKESGAGNTGWAGM